MGKKRVMPICDGVQYDSQEELDFKYFLDELNIPYIYHPDSLILAESVKIPVTVQLKTKTITVYKTLLKGCSYEADFLIKESDVPKFIKNNVDWRASDGNYYIDVKGVYSQNADANRFSLVRKWIYQRHSIFINKVIPVNLFISTFCPEKVRYTKLGKVRKPYLKALTKEEFIARCVNESN